MLYGERKSRDNAMLVTETIKATLQDIIHKHVHHGSTIRTDDDHSYKGVAHWNKTVNYSARKSVNEIKSVWEAFKRRLLGTYHYWSATYCRQFIYEFVFHLNGVNLEVDTQGRQKVMFGIIFGKQMTYQALTR